MNITINKIREVLHQKGCSIKQLAENMDIDYAQAHRMVSRESLDGTDLSTLIRVAAVLKVDIKELYQVNKKHFSNLKFKEDLKMIKSLSLELLELAEREIIEVGFIDDNNGSESFLNEQAYKLLLKETKDKDRAFIQARELVEEVEGMLKKMFKHIKINKDTFVYVKDKEGLNKYADIHLAITTGDTHSREDVQELVDRLI